MKLLKFLQVQYRDGARGEDGYYDCWGLARAIRYEIYGKSLLGDYAGYNRLKPILFEHCLATDGRNAKKVEGPIEGAIAAVLKKKLCVHVGVVVRNGENMGIMDINPMQGAKIHKFSDFRRRFSDREIVFYD